MGLATAKLFVKEGARVIVTGRTPATIEAAQADQVYVQIKEIVLMKRIGQPEEIARAVAFFAFDATYTTGAELPVDGGWSQL